MRNDFLAGPFCKRLRGWTLLLVIAAGCIARADDWPQWRGPDRNGISRETQWLDVWPDQGPRIAWKAQVGLGFSSVSVARGRLFTLGHAQGQDTVWGLEAETGRVLWKHSYDSDLGDKYFEGGTTSTPAVQGDRVYVLSRWGDLFCFDAETGRVIWNKNVQKETGARIPGWGFSGSPSLAENLLLLNIGEAGLALDPKSGRVIWQSANKDAGYSTPLPVSIGGEPCAIFSSGQAYAAVHLATGREKWRIRWLTEYGANAADPVLAGNILFLSTGYGKGAAAFHLGHEPPEMIWKNKTLRTQLNTSVWIDGHVYGIDGDTTERAALKCVELATGLEKWKQAGLGSGALMAADGKLIVLSDRGELMAAPASPNAFKPTARAQVLGGKCWTVPVLANGRIYCRNSRGDLVAVDVRKND